MRIAVTRNVWLLWFRYEMFLTGTCMNTRYPASWTLLWSYRKFRRWHLREPGPKSCGSVSYLLLSGEQPLPHGRIAMMLVLLTDRAKPSRTKLSHPKVFLSGVWRKRWWNGQIKWRSPATTLHCFNTDDSSWKKNRDSGHAQWRLLVSQLLAVCRT